jgi:CRISPR/Cas system-associated protein Cas10 (large subunit of type III CRISPR-Cas system)
MDQVLSRIGYLPGDTPLIRDEAHWRVDPDVLEIARSRKDKDLAKAVYEQIKRTGAEPEEAKQAVQRALDGR